MAQTIEFRYDTQLLLEPVDDNELDVDLIHDYHHRYVEEENKPLFCRLVGSGMMIAGIGFASMGILSNALGKQGYMISLGLLFLGILIAAITIVKFNAIHQVKDYAKKRERKK